MDISVVIPVYGCRAALTELYRRLVESVSKITNEFEIILVNDNCPQNSWEVIEELCANDKRVKGIELSRNFGQMRAILAGLRIDQRKLSDYMKKLWKGTMWYLLEEKREEIIR